MKKLIAKLLLFTFLFTSFDATYASNAYAKTTGRYTSGSSHLEDGTDADVNAVSDTEGETAGSSEQAISNAGETTGSSEQAASDAVGATGGSSEQVNSDASTGSGDELSGNATPGSETKTTTENSDQSVSDATAQTGMQRQADGTYSYTQGNESPDEFIVRESMSNVPAYNSRDDGTQGTAMVPIPDVQSGEVAEPEADYSVLTDEEIQKLITPMGMTNDYVVVPEEKEIRAYGAGGSSILADDSFFDVTPVQASQASASAYPSTDPLATLAANYPGTRSQFAGTCWAHSIVASAEFYSIKNGILSTGTQTDLSEYQVAYFGYHSPKTKLFNGTANDSYTFVKANANGESWLTIGHNIFFVIHTLNSWYALTTETAAPTPTYTNLMNGLQDRLAYSKNVLTLSDVRIISTSDRDAVKKAIISNGAVCTSYYAGTQGSPSNYAAIDPNLMVNWYCETAQTANHAIAIVGWNDNYPSNYFHTAAPGNGAWLVRNSWTTETGYSINSYFWMSYYDKSIIENVYALSFVASSKYQNNYQYDGTNDSAMVATSAESAYSLGNNAPKGANVFSASSGHKNETLKAVNLTFKYRGNYQYKIEIYLDPQQNNPSSGTLVAAATTTGETTYPGIYTIPLASEVSLNQGQYYSVVVTAWRMENGKYKYYLPDMERAYDGWTWMSETVAAEAGQSYTFNGSNWTPLLKEKSTKGTGNLCIKAFTVDDGLPPVGKSYVITLNPNGGLVSAKTKNVKKGLPIGKLVTPTYTNRTFLGWYTEKNGGTLVTENMDYPYEDNITLYAHWSEPIYKVRFNGNGGTISFASKDVKLNEQIGTLPSVQYEGYTFLGWFTKPSGGVQYTQYSLMRSTQGLTLYAQWKATDYNITYYLNGGANNNNPTVYNAKSNVLLKTPTRRGYTFQGWYLTSQFTPASKITRISFTVLRGMGYQIGALRIYASWKQEATSSTTMFDANGGIAVSGTYRYYQGKRVGTMPTTSRSGYSFNGWYTSPSGGTRISSTTVWRDTYGPTLYAHWTKIRYTITYMLGGGQNHKNNVYSRFKEQAVTFYNPTRTGYTFAGWYNTPTYRTQITGIAAGSLGGITLYAKWVPNTYTVTFNANGGSGGTTLNRTYGSTYRISSQGITRNGYKLKGFATSATFAKAGRVQYRIGASYKNLTHSQNGRVTLYAVWGK